MKFSVFTIIVMVIIALPIPVWAYDKAPRISDREISERLITLEQRTVILEQGQKAILREIDKRFEAMDKQFTTMNQDMNQRFAQNQSLIIGILVAFASLVAVTIDFAIWDRRTAVKPVNDRVNQLEIDLQAQKKKFEAFLDNLRKHAGSDDRLAEVLRSISFL